MKKILSFKIVLIYFTIAVLTIPGLMNANEDETERPYRLINSDLLHVDLVNGEYVSRLTGNVNFFYGETEFYTDEAQIYETQELVVMRGNVRVYDDSLSLYAEEVEYYRLEEKLNLRHNVHIREDHHDGTIRTYKSDSSTYLREDRKLFSFENTHFYDESEAVRGQCNFLEYDMETQYGYVTGSPNIFVGSTDTLHIKSERIEFYDDFNRLAASFDVRTTYTVAANNNSQILEVSPDTLQTKDTKPIVYNIHSDFLLFFTEDDYAVFMGQPLFLSDEAEGRAERFYVYFEDEKIKSATLENDCIINFAVAEDGALNSKVEAKIINLLFRDGAIIGIEATEKVASLYVDDEVAEPVTNEAFSDRLNIYFNDDNEIETIVFTGQVTGTYKFSSGMMEITDDQMEE